VNSLPFTIEGVFLGLANLVGIARLDGQDLCLEFRTEHPLSEFIKSESKEVRIPLADLDEVAFKSRFCIGYLNLRARRLALFEQVPGNEGDRLRLRCRRSDWAAARELASRLSMHTVKREIQDLLDATSPPSRNLPAPTIPAESEPHRPKTPNQTPQAGQK
jgi:hypothetical protein